jgi:serine/threonine protein kinase
MLNWTYNPGVFSIALPLGTSVREAVKKRKVSFWNVASDILSAMMILCDLNVSHNDIKVENIVYHEGKVKLIDFGILTPTTDYLNTSTVDHFLITLGYRDPAGHFDHESDYRFELYSVAGVLATLFGGVDRVYEKEPLPLLKFSSKRETNFYEDLIRYPLEARLNIRELFRKYPELKLQTGSILETPVYPMSGDCSPVILEKVIEWMFGLITTLGMKIQTLFLCLHLFRRVLPVLLPNHLNNSEQKAKIQGLALACLSLTTLVTDDAVIFDFENGVIMSDDAYTEKQIEEMAVNILIASKGTLITESPWNYTRNSEELVWAFLGFFRCDYQVNAVPFAEGSDSRLLKIKEFYKLVKAKVNGSTYLKEAEKAPISEIRTSFPILINYRESQITTPEVNLEIGLYNANTARDFYSDYKLGVILRHDYGVDSATEVNAILSKLKRSQGGRRYTDILENQVIPFQYLMPPVTP